MAERQERRPPAGGLPTDDDSQRRLTQFFPRVDVTSGPGGTVNITNMNINYQQVYNHPPPPAYDHSRLTLGNPPPPDPEVIAAAMASAARAAVDAAIRVSSSHSRGRPAGSVEVFSAAEAFEASVLGKRAREKKRAAHKTHKRKFKRRAEGMVVNM